MVQQFKPSVERPTGGDSPLKDFRGTLASYVSEERTSQADQSKYMIVNFNFTDVEVYDSDEPYPFPIAIIKIGYKPPKESRGGTKWDAFASSLRKLSPGSPDLDLLVGQRQRWTRLPFKIRSPLTDDEGNPQLDGNQRQIWGDLDIPCWKVVEVESLGSAEEKDADFNKFLVDLADGKTEPKFYEAALTNSEVTKRTNIVEAITGRKLLSTLMEMNLLERDAEGILHKVAAPAEAPA